MRLQIIPSERQKHLQNFYGCYLWKIYPVYKFENKKSHGNCKIKKEWTVYYVELTFITEHRKGEKYLMSFLEDECLILK